MPQNHHGKRLPLITVLASAFRMTMQSSPLDMFMSNLLCSDEGTGVRLAAALLVDRAPGHAGKDAGILLPKTTSNHSTSRLEEVAPSVSTGSTGNNGVATTTAGTSNANDNKTSNRSTEHSKSVLVSMPVTASSSRRIPPLIDPKSSPACPMRKLSPYQPQLQELLLADANNKVHEEVQVNVRNDQYNTSVHSTATEVVKSAATRTSSMASVRPPRPEISSDALLQGPTSSKPPSLQSNGSTKPPAPKKKTSHSKPPRVPVRLVSPLWKGRSTDLLSSRVAAAKATPNPSTPASWTMTTPAISRVLCDSVTKSDEEQREQAPEEQQEEELDVIASSTVSPTKLVQRVSDTLWGPNGPLAAEQAPVLPIRKVSKQLSITSLLSDLFLPISEQEDHDALEDSASSNLSWIATPPPVTILKGHRPLQVVDPSKASLQANFAQALPSTVPSTVHATSMATGSPNPSNSSRPRRFVTSSFHGSSRLPMYPSTLDIPGLPPAPTLRTRRDVAEERHLRQFTPFRSNKKQEEETTASSSPVSVACDSPGEILL